ncbi:MAG: 3-methyladenine DNA glycosylase [Actinomycetota bacterium]|nr:3-methyladenine DNA glycosylase [Actinomycetota bacterium]
MTSPSEQLMMAAADWRVVAADHAARVDELTAAHRNRVGTRRPHPVEDFLFSYYSLRPAQLRRWYPGAGIGLADAAERADWRFHRSQGGVVTVDVTALMVAHGDQIRFVHRLLGATAGRPAQFGCFGLHEWAMVFGAADEHLRHADRPLRLGRQRTDNVVRAHQIRCTHYDAYRFFTEPARPRNLLQPSLNTREQLEQPGCLHVGMDLYKWAYKLIPAVPSELLVDCFLMAKDVREVDMRASPYDLADLGYPPIPIETAAGKAEYVARQREFADRSVPLRARLLTVTQLLTAHG